MFLDLTIFWVSGYFKNAMNDGGAESGNVTTKSLVEAADL